jgi:hypothetical protein
VILSCRWQVLPEAVTNDASCRLDVGRLLFQRAVSALHLNLAQVIDQPGRQMGHNRHRCPGWLPNNLLGGLRRASQAKPNTGG